MNNEKTSQENPVRPIPGNSVMNGQKNNNDSIWHRFGITPEELNTLLEFRANWEQRNKTIIFLTGVIFTPFTLIGVLFGYIRGYNRLLRPKDLLPDFYPMRPAVRAAMIAGAVLIWIIEIAITAVILVFIGNRDGYTLLGILVYLFVNTFFSLIVWFFFSRWQVGANNEQVESKKFGTARFAREDELKAYTTPKGIYIGGAYRYQKQGHLLTIAGSRSGKFTNLIAPNLLGMGDIDGSWVVIDPKGEICAVTSDYQGKAGQNIVVLNPWGLIEDNVPAGQSYNPLDILDVQSPHLVDDCYILAEMLVPLETGKNRFFSDSARSVVAGLILYIAVSQEDDDRSLKTLWKWARYPESEWDRILAGMQNWDETDPNSENLLFASSEIEKLAKSGSNTWGSILSTVLQATEFLKSPALQKAMVSGFDPKTLAHDSVTLYVIIPADKLQSHSRWLRLIVTSTMRAVIRRPGKRVCFLLDEFAALGYLSEIEIALGTYAGFNVTVWPILQSLVQLQNLYEKNWEVFIGNTAVRHFFGLHNNFDTEYISKAIGKKSFVLSKKAWFGTSDAESTERYLITPDELRIASGRQIFTFIDDVQPTYFEKMPYYNVPFLNERAGNNPYLAVR